MYNNKNKKKKEENDNKIILKIFKNMLKINKYKKYKIHHLCRTASLSLPKIAAHFPMISFETPNSVNVLAAFSMTAL